MLRFVTALGLLVALLAIAPYVAHRLRRRRAEERPFAPARLVPAAKPKARRRAQLEDRALFLVRVLAVVALALLGASPLVRCSRLSLARASGASVAMVLVVDDSMSMRAPQGRTTRLRRAVDGARELVSSAREGDAIAVVLAGAPARVLLATTYELGAVRAALDTITESDRGTDLDGALGLGRSLVEGEPQVDRRVVLFSDLADGSDGAPPVGEGPIPVWVPLPELAGDASDCAVLSADRSLARVRVKIACSIHASLGGRELVLRAGDHVVGRAPAAADVLLAVPANETAELVAELTGSDAIAADDRAPVVAEAGLGAVAVVVDPATETAVTGGAPVVEQALSALRSGVELRPLPVLPDRGEDLAGFLGLVVDDPPGFTPEQRRALGSFFQAGGTLLLALGPRAAVAPLGASLAPVLDEASDWIEQSAPGADRATAHPLVADSAASLGELGASHRTRLAPSDASAAETLVRWTDGAPLMLRRPIGRGQAWIVTLPFSVDGSDLVLRPGFLALLDAWQREARARLVPARTEAGRRWAFVGAKSVAAEGPAGAIAPVVAGAEVAVIPPLIGAYRVTVDGRKELRVAAPNARELDFRPRRIAPQAANLSLGATRSDVDIAWLVALLLLGLTATELVLRARVARAA